MIIPDDKNLIGARRKSGYINKNYPEFYNMLMKNYPIDIQFKERLYWYYNNISEYPRCRNCGRLLKFKDGKIGYGIFCSTKCANSNTEQLKKRIDTRSLKQDDIITKTNNTIIEKYGSIENYNRIRFQKIRKTNLEKYGVEYPLQSKSILKKTQETVKDKYGVSCTLLLENVKDKSKSTNFKKYGVEKYTNREKYVETRKKQYIKEHDDIIDRIKKNDVNFYICKCNNKYCNKCENKQFEIPCSIYHTRRYQGIEQCTLLNPIGYDGSNTSLEISIKNLLDKYNIKYESNNRIILHKKELDIYIPDKKVAIECNGIFWHSDRNVNNLYHKWKYTACAAEGIQLLTLWEDQFHNSKDIIESIVLSKLGIYKERIYARKCVIKEVNKSQCTQFLIDNHLQGNINSSIKIGLYYNDELVSIMCFGKLRKSLGKNNLENSYELYRFCNKLNTQVIGGASKLFTYFIEKYNPTIIESFSSNDISAGYLYSKLGFEYVDESILYWYIKSNNGVFNRYHRYKFRKSELVKMGYDSNKSEYDIMNNMKNFYRIYDSGQTKWLWKKR